MSGHGNRNPCLGFKGPSFIYGTVYICIYLQGPKVMGIEGKVLKDNMSFICTIDKSMKGPKVLGIEGKVLKDGTSFIYL